MRYFVGVLLLSLSLLSFGQDRIVVFIEDQNVQDNEYLNLDYSSFTDIVFAFANPDGTGDLDFRFGTGTVQSFINYAHDRGVRVHLSFGGSANGDAGWVGNVGTYRTQFVDRIGQYVAAWDLDGVNLDWEFPAGGYATNYGLMASAMKTKLNALEATEGRNLELTCAVAPLQWNTDGINSTFLNSMDYVYVMAFDDGTCNGCGGPNHSSLTLATNGFNYWKSTKGVAASKIVIAIPFYSNTKSAYGTFSASNPSAYYNDADGSYGGQYYNSMPLIEDKIDMVRTKGGAGIFVWEVTQDRSDEYSLLKGIASYFGDALNCPGPSLGDDADLCETTNVILDAGVNKSGMTYQWYLNNVEIDEGSVSQTYPVTSAGTYKVVVNKAGCTEKSDQITITSSLLTVSGDLDICEQDQTALSVSNHDGNDVLWYTQSSGGASFMTGTSYTTPVLTSNVTYYLEADVEVGSNCQGIAEWSASVPNYNGGDWVVYQGNLYECMFWAAEVPADQGSGDPWRLRGSCGGTACARTEVAIVVNDCVDGLADVEASEYISIYPNPAENHLSIKTEYRIERIDLFNVSGGKELDFSLDGETLSLGTSLATGMYILRVYTDTGAFVYEFSKE